MRLSDVEQGGVDRLHVVAVVEHGSVGENGAAGGNSAVAVVVVAEKMELGAHRSYPFEQQPVAVMRRFVAVAAVEDAERWLVRNQNVSLVGDFASGILPIMAS